VTKRGCVKTAGRKSEKISKVSSAINARRKILLFMPIFQDRFMKQIKSEFTAKLWLMTSYLNIYNRKTMKIRNKKKWHIMCHFKFVQCYLYIIQAIISK